MARVICVLLFSMPSAAVAQELHLRNDIGQPMYVWHQLEGSPDYQRPPLYLGKGAVNTISLSEPGCYYLNLVDEMNREAPIGWKDLHRVYAKNPNAEVLLKVLYATVMEMRSVETWERIGFRRWRRVVHSDPTPQTVVKNVTLRIMSHGEVYDFDEFLR